MQSIRRSAFRTRLRISRSTVSHYRPLSTTRPLFNPDQPGQDPSLSQGHVTDPSQKHSQDPHSQVTRKALDAAADEPVPHDAASPTTGGEKAPSGAKGNPEGVGFADQVGSASATAGATASKNKPGGGTMMGGAEESTPPGLFSTVKQALGVGTTSDDVKQNKGGGEGVTGTGTNPSKSRKYHTSAVCHADKTKGQAPEASRQPKDKTYGDQNEHLKHKKSEGEPDKGKGNAAEDPVLPSHQQQGPAGHNTGGSGYGSEEAERFER